MDYINYNSVIIDKAKSKLRKTIIMGWVIKFIIIVYLIKSAYGIQVNATSYDVNIIAFGSLNVLGHIFSCWVGIRLVNAYIASIMEDFKKSVELYNKTFNIYE